MAAEQDDNSKVPQPILDSLSRRDIGECMRGYTPPNPRTLGDRLSQLRGKWHPDNSGSPTYRAVTGQPYTYDLFSRLHDSGRVPAGIAADLEQGNARIPGIDQLALSKQPTSLIQRLDYEGYGLWPIPDRQRFDRVDLDKLRIGLTERQVAFLTVLGKDLDTRDIGGLWMRDGRLVDKARPFEKPIIEDYLPTLTEALTLVERFHEQEGYFPNSYNHYLLTRSQIPLSLSQAFQEVSGRYSNWEIFMEACINASAYPGEIRQYLAMPGDFNAKTGWKHRATREGGVMKITKDVSWREPVYFEQQGADYLDVKLPDGPRLQLVNGILRITKDVSWYEPVYFRSPFATVAREIDLKRQTTQEYFERVIMAPLLIRVNRDLGVSLGVGFHLPEDVTRLSLADGRLQFDWRSKLAPVIAAQLQGFPAVTKAAWPQVYQDSHVKHIYDGKKR